MTLPTHDSLQAAATGILARLGASPEPGDLPAPDSGKHALAGNKSGWVVVLVSAVCATLVAVLVWLVLHG